MSLVSLETWFIHSVTGLKPFCDILHLYLPVLWNSFYTYDSFLGSTFYVIFVFFFLMISISLISCFRVVWLFLLLICLIILITVSSPCFSWTLIHFIVGTILFSKSCLYIFNEIMFFQLYKVVWCLNFIHLIVIVISGLFHLFHFKRSYLLCLFIQVPHLKFMLIIIFAGLWLTQYEYHSFKNVLVVVSQWQSVKRVPWLAPLQKRVIISQNIIWNKWIWTHFNKVAL